MNVETFSEHFAIFAEAPNAVGKLRDFIVQLGVKGLLVPQDENEEPASELLLRVEKEKCRLAKLGRLKSPSQLPEVDAIPGPKGWINARLGMFIELISGQHLKPEEYNKVGEGHPYLTGPADFGEHHPVASRWTHADRALACRDDILITVKGAGIGKCNVVGTKTAFISRQLMAVRPIIVDRGFIHLILQSGYNQFQNQGVGIAIPGIGRDDILQFVVGLPPLAEQRRVVVKVDQLMRLCDELAMRRTARHEARFRCVEATLDRLVSARSASELHTHANSLRDHFDRLFDTPTTIPQLRQAILQLAVQGQLVTQDPNDESASVADTNSEIQGLFDIPKSWRWVTVDQIAESRLGKMLDKAKNKGKPFAYLRNTNVHWFRFDLTSIKEMPFSQAELHEFEVRSGDVLICEGGHGIGRTAVWNEDLDQMMFQKALHRIRPSRDLDGNFFAYCMRVYDATGVLQTYYTGAGIPHLTGRSLAKIAFPLPPLAEQKRIVSKVAELLSMCEALESKLTQAESASNQLLSAAIHNLLNGLQLRDGA